jgi:hypothetical protein
MDNINTQPEDCVYETLSMKKIHNVNILTMKDNDKG